MSRLPTARPRINGPAEVRLESRWSSPAGPRSVRVSGNGPGL